MRQRIAELEKKIEAGNPPKSDMMEGNQLKVETKSEYALRRAFWTGLLVFIVAFGVSFWMYSEVNRGLVSNDELSFGYETIAISSFFTASFFAALATFWVWMAMMMSTRR